jgi:RND family efflux transporter MFP subunit
MALCLCVIATGGGCSNRTAEEVETATAVTVTTATAERGTLRGVVHATGVVSPAPDAELIVVAPEPARIAEIPHASGERVRRGDLLVRFEIPASAAEVQKQQAEVARAEAGLENAKAAQTRARDLFDRGVAARKEAEDANRAAADAQAALAQAKAALNAAETVERRATVRATFDGVVAKRSHNPGDLVEAAASDPVLRVVDPDRLEIVAAVPLSDALRVQVGAAGPHRRRTDGGGRCRTHGEVAADRCRTWHGDGPRTARVRALDQYPGGHARADQHRGRGTS